MSRKRKTHPYRQVKGCAHQSTSILSQRKAKQELAMAAFGMFCLFGLPRLMYLVIAPMKGWM